MRKVLLIAFLFNVLIFYSQSEVIDLRQHYIWFDAIIEEGKSELYNGFKYFDNYRTKNKDHQFFKSRDFQLGNVNYNGQIFYNVYMKYDVYKDNLVLRLPNQNNYVIVKLIKERVYSFSLGDHNFVNIPLSLDELIEPSLKGFYEVLKKTNSTSLYKKHLKLEQKEILLSKIYSKFIPKKNYLINYNNSYYIIKSYKDFRVIFPNYKRQVSDYYRRQKKLYATNKDKFYSNLVAMINILKEKFKVKK